MAGVQGGLLMAKLSVAKRGLYANINARRKAGKRPKRPGEKGYPTAKAFKQSAKTAKK